MKICFITAYFPFADHRNSQEKGAHFGGVERFVYEICKRLAKKHEVSIIATKVSKNAPDYEEMDGIKIYRYPLTFQLFRSPFSIKAILGIRKIDSDVNVVLGTYAMYSELAVLMSKLKGTTTVLNYHFEGRADGFVGAICTSIYYATFARMMNLADILIATSKDYAKSSRFLRKKDVLVVPNGVDLSCFKPGEKKSKILFVGRLVTYKGLKYLIKAMRKVVSLYPKVQLDIIGDGPLRDELTLAVKMSGLEKNINFKGHVTREELIREYREASIFVLPSINKSEAFGITLIEAMACSVPVIASNLKGVRTIGKYGLLVKPK
ncbi:MAG: glycosyltransferase family 4 protein, partial [Candidatus Aenigmarchaeota archaeon]|nr:glycosyltransferase family 4 protein [Candidatus Aenigmarchaeota archaeon]